MKSTEQHEDSMPGLVVPALLASLVSGLCIALLLMGLVLVVSPGPAHAQMLESGGAVISPVMLDRL
jgi:hypothetical protein